MIIKSAFVFILMTIIAGACTPKKNNWSQGDVLGRSLVGKSKRQVVSIMKSEFSQYQFNVLSTCRERTGIQRYQIGPSTYIHLIFADTLNVHGNIANDDRVSRYEIASLSKITNRMPNVDYEIIEAIHHAPSPEGAGFDPVALVTVVNRLQSLGAPEALRALKNYYNLATESDPELRFKYDLDEQRIFLILRLLFSPKDGTSKMPCLRLGQPVPQLCASTDDWPIFPLVLIEDIPFFMIEGYILAGVSESPLVHLEYCEHQCVIRASPLQPSADAVASVEQEVKSERWKKLFAWYPSSVEEDCEQLLRTQALVAQAAIKKSSYKSLNKMVNATNNFWIVPRPYLNN